MAINESSSDKTPTITGENTFTQTGGGLHRVELRDGAGVVGYSKNRQGVVGITDGTGFAGVYGKGKSEGVIGSAENGFGVCGYGTGPNGIGVFGQGGENMAAIVGNTLSASQPGILGQNNGTGPGVEGHSKNEAGVRGVSTQGTGIVGIGGAFAAQFVGTVQVQGNITVSGDVVLSGADYAEALSTKDLAIGAGCVVVIGPGGDIHLCDRDYDSSVAGIVSGAGGVKPAIVLDRHEGSADVALIGKVWCRADADAAPIRPGDLLTTSSTIGHCRRVTEPGRAFGAIIGKALTPLPSGKGLVRVLVSPR
ncbi:hypothetical protein [Rhizobium mongolense]|uniref:hypothetical protein n=1 Tax=Rhizobium mongolense TaxID=57676 RepID=UPI0034A198A9